ncbi:melanocortin receptor 4-like [Oculina patagonica]
MATANFNGDGKQQTLDKLLFSADLTAGIHGQLKFISVLNIFLSITAFFCNVLILFALRKESSLHPPSKLLLRSLATTDLCVGLISEPLYVIFLMSVVNQHWNICRYVLVAAITIGNVLCGVSLFTLAAISVDRLLALLLGLRYKQVVTLKRTYVIVITFWVVCAVFLPMYFLIPIIITWFVIATISLCLVTSIFSYTKIFLNLRHHQTQLQDQAQQPNELNIARYRKAVSSALWLQLTLVACYVPFDVVMSVLTNSELASYFYLAWGYTLTLVFLNSSLNPILYFWKMDEVRQAVKDTITTFFIR